MQNFILFITCTLIWGGNYFATKYQYGVVASEYSVLFRLLIAFVLFLILNGMFKNTKKKLSFSDHSTLALFGTFSFSVNYILFYYAAGYLISSYIVIIFSVKSIISPILFSIIKRQKLSRNLIAGALISIVGVVFLLKDSFQNAHLSFYGIILALLGTVLTSIGDVFSMKNVEKDIPPIQANMWGLFYSILIMTFYTSIFIPQKITVISTVGSSYYLSLLYLAVFASFLAWLCFLNLIKRIGAANASYMVTLFPAVGIILSILFENLNITGNLIFGLCLQLIGSFIAFYRQIINSIQKFSTKKATIANVE
ncbi:DMT family transporter [Fluviispira multicolorata]|nr:DMT family transporter [Fluviispira multicolorata]